MAEQPVRRRVPLKLCQYVAKQGSGQQFTSLLESERPSVDPSIPIEWVNRIIGQSLLYAQVGHFMGYLFKTWANSGSFEASTYTLAI